MSRELTSLIAQDTTIRVSSVLDKSAGRKNLVDGSPETCWTSQEGLPQYIQLNFPNRVTPKHIHLTFQGGFVGTQCEIYAESDSEGTGSTRWKLWTSIYPEDVNRRQSFDLPPYVDEQCTESGIRALKLIFKQSSDFFGRITVYDLKIEGIVVS